VSDREAGGDLEVDPGLARKSRRDPPTGDLSPHVGGGRLPDGVRGADESRVVRLVPVDVGVEHGRDGRPDEVCVDVGGPRHHVGKVDRGREAAECSGRRSGRRRGHGVRAVVRLSGALDHGGRDGREGGPPADRRFYRLIVLTDQVPGDESHGASPPGLGNQPISSTPKWWQVIVFEAEADPQPAPTVRVLAVVVSIVTFARAVVGMGVTAHALTVVPRYSYPLPMIVPAVPVDRIRPSYSSRQGTLVTPEAVATAAVVARAVPPTAPP